MHRAKRVGEERVLPGKKSAELLDLRDEYVPKAVSQMTPIFIGRSREQCGSC